MNDPLPTAVLGARTPVVLLHGVGLDASWLSDLACRLAGDHEVLLPDRRGYGRAGRRRTADLATQADDVADVLDHFGHARANIVGVSGGATLAIAFALAHPHRVSRVVAHEPLVGPLAGALHEKVRARAVALRDDPRLAAAEEFVAALAGPETWTMLGERAARQVRQRAHVVRAEVVHFASFAPTAAELRALRLLPLTTTHGERSGVERAEAAAVLADLAGADIAVVPGAGHLAHLDAPDAFAELVADLLVARCRAGDELRSGR